MAMELADLYSYHKDPSQLFGIEIYPYKEFMALLPERKEVLEETGEIMNQELEQLIRIMPHRDKDVEDFITTPNNYTTDLVIPYAGNVLKKRWPEGEQAIIADHNGYTARLYAMMFNQRIPELEPTIMKVPINAYFYAVDTIEGRWPEAEESIRQNENIWREYKDLWNIDESI